MDINLVGEINGIEVAEKIQSTREIPVVFMSGYVDTDYMKEAAHIKSLAFIQKPIDIDVLLRLIDSQG